MTINYNPRIVTDGLVFYIDPANIKSNPNLVYNPNLLDISTWAVGSGSVGIFSMNGTTEENIRVYANDPFGQSSIIWNTPSNDIASDGDGGWGTSSINIDPTKMYRFTTWVNRTVIGNGTFYFGCYGMTSAGVNEGVLYRINGAVNTNPYFYSNAWGGLFLANTWYLVVGHVWPAGSGTGSSHSDSGVYTVDGTKISSAVNDYVWQSTNFKTVHRTYLYYSTDITTSQRWSHPSLELCDGNEVPLNGLFSNQINKIYDLSINKHVGVLINKPIHSNNNKGHLVFDGVDSFIAFPTTPSISGPISMMAWINRSNNSLILSNFTQYGLFANGRCWYWSADSSAWVNYTSTVTPPSNIWCQLAVTYTPGSADLPIFYINDVFNTSTGTTPLPNNSGVGSTLFLGEYSGYRPYAPFGGKIGPSMIYNRVLTPDEIKQNYHAFRGRYGI